MLGKKEYLNPLKIFLVFIIRNVHFHFRLVKVISTALDFINLAKVTMQRQNVSLFEKNDITVDYKSTFL